MAKRDMRGFKRPRAGAISDLDRCRFAHHTAIFICPANQRAGSCSVLEILPSPRYLSIPQIARCIPLHAPATRYPRFFFLCPPSPRPHPPPLPCPAPPRPRPHKKILSKTHPKRFTYPSSCHNTPHPLRRTVPHPRLRFPLLFPLRRRRRPPPPSP